MTFSTFCSHSLSLFYSLTLSLPLSVFLTLFLTLSFWPVSCLLGVKVDLRDPSYPGYSSLKKALKPLLIAQWSPARAIGPAIKNRNDYQVANLFVTYSNESRTKWLRYSRKSSLRLRLARSQIKRLIEMIAT